MSDKQNSVYRDIAERTGGDIYIGVVGPVRTGKSTFIKRFMETLVIPNIEGDFKRERAMEDYINIIQTERLKGGNQAGVDDAALMAYRDKKGMEEPT